MLLLAIVLCGALSPWAQGAWISAPCSACKAIASELQARLDDEPVRNHLDMRHRLDSQGQRYGKVIDYKVSELRVIELLDGLCNNMNKWTLVTINSTHGETWHWEPVSEAVPGSRPAHNEEEVRQKQLTSFCGGVLEEYDDDITEAIQKGKLEEGGIVKVLCEGIVKTCPVGASKKAAGTETSDGTTSARAALDAVAATPAATQTAEPDQPAAGAEPASDTPKEEL